VEDFMAFLGYELAGVLTIVASLVILKLVLPRRGETTAKVGPKMELIASLGLTMSLGLGAMMIVYGLAPPMTSAISEPTKKR
jgi:hypothetical protein